MAGEDVGLFLERGQPPLRDGDCLLAQDGRVVRVSARPEALLHVTCANAFELTRAAYHLGNRHVALQIGDGWLRLLDDYVLLAMLEQLGARVERIEAGFQPEHAPTAAATTPTTATPTSTTRRACTSSECAREPGLAAAAPRQPPAAHRRLQLLASPGAGGGPGPGGRPAERRTLDHRPVAAEPRALRGTLLLALCEAAADADWARFSHLGECQRASRETRELQLENRQMGYSLQQLLEGLPELDAPARSALDALHEPVLGCAWALAARTWRITRRTPSPPGSGAGWRISWRY